jgi:hypothetical protein
MQAITIKMYTPHKQPAEGRNSISIDRPARRSRPPARQTTGFRPRNKVVYGFIFTSAARSRSYRQRDTGGDVA